MAWIPAAIAAGASIAEAASSRKGASDANQQNINLNAENRDWQERMSNTEVQRRVKDLQAAGLNPMLGYAGSASTPSTSPAQVQNTRAQASQIMASGISSSAAALLTQANIRKTNAEATVLEASIPHSADNARNTAFALKLQGEKLAKEVNALELEGYAQKADYDSKRKLQELSVQYQSYVNQATKLGLSEKEADARFYDAMGAAGKGADVAGKAAQFIMMMKQLSGK